MTLEQSLNASVKTFATQCSEQILKVLREAPFAEVARYVGIDRQLAPSEPYVKPYTDVLDTLRRAKKKMSKKELVDYTSLSYDQVGRRLRKLLISGAVDSSMRAKSNVPLYFARGRFMTSDE